MHIPPRKALCAVFLVLCWPGKAQPAEERGYSVAEEPFRRDLVSISLADVEKAGHATGVYEGSSQYLANREAYAAAFYETLAARKVYSDIERTRWRIEPIPNLAPPPCGRPQPTRYDADSCRYVSALFKGLERSSPELARKYREQVRRGRDVWFKGTFGNQDLYSVFLPKASLRGPPDYSSWLDTRNRDKRFRDFGLINDPDCRPGSLDTFWLDDCDDPHASGVVGIRKYAVSNAEDSDPRSSSREDGEFAAGNRFDLGFACASCHAAFDPTNPPADPASPRWENIMGGIGNQYIRHGALFAQGLPEDDFAHRITAAQRPGTSDTSLVANDFIHNPSTINAIFNTHNRPVFEHVMRHPITGQTARAKTRHILKGGEDSVGERLATLRVYLNIGVCAEECWVDNFPTPGALLFGKTTQSPFRIGECAKTCEAWNYVEAKTDDLLSYLLTVGPAYLDKAVDVDGTPGSAFIDHTKVPRGRRIFIERCASCHSSKPIPEFLDLNDTALLSQFYEGHIFGGFHNWRREFPPGFAESSGFRPYLDAATGMPKQVLAGAQDWLGNDEREPYDEIGVNRCRAMHTNHGRGNIFEDFASLTFHESRPAASIRRAVNPLVPLVGGTNPLGERERIEGGRGYYRNVSLLGIWSSAPLLHNNALGPYITLEDGAPDYTVKGRVKAFEAALDELLMSDDPGVTPHREPVLSTLPSLVWAPLREDGKGFLWTPAWAGSPIGFLASANPHYPVYSQCDDFVENKGHQFGIDLSAEDKLALIEFLKTL